MHRTHHECVRWTHAVKSTVKSSKLFLDGFIQQKVDVELDVLWQKGRFQKCSCFQAPCLNYHNHQHRNALILMCNVRTWSPTAHQAFKDPALQDLFSLVYFNIKSKSFDKNSFFLVKVKLIFTNWCQRVKMFCVNIKIFLSTLFSTLYMGHRLLQACFTLCDWKTHLSGSVWWLGSYLHLVWDCSIWSHPFLPGAAEKPRFVILSTIFCCHVNLVTYF